ncbi:hypothetical protein L3Q82_012113 [Scortum barcoo]|uniref:Uncharacterized protein n=1 Tax=Scortum barcoo TaxID=214431 RepID=A0ACB8W792_9TELE|nr:hypothetical protein L3Q82_012113 [Scortum barcoo]
MIDFVVVSSDLRPYVLDTRVKRGAELSTDHHLVVSWIRWQRRKLDRPGQTQTHIVRVCWERLAIEPSVREVFNSHLRKSFSQIPREAGDIESEWTMFSASIVNVQWQFEAVDARSLVPVKGCSVSAQPEQELGSHCRQGRRESRFGNHRISSLLFADDVVLLASSRPGPSACAGVVCSLSVKRLLDEESAPPNPRPWFFDLEIGWHALSGWVERSFLKWIKFMYLGVLFTSEGKMECEIDRRIGAASA